MFERATRLKLRFNTNRGNLSVEDLWDLPLTSVSGVNLDDLARAENKALKESEEESFVVKPTKTSSGHELRLNILKRIIKVKLEERSASERSAINAQKREEIMSAIKKQKSDSLTKTSVEDLEKMLEELS